MKHLISTLGLLAAVAGTTGFIAFRASGDSQVAQALAKNDTMEWLRADFELTDEQFATVKKLHDSYSVICEEHCREIMRALRARNELKTSRADAAALAAADHRIEELRLLCESAIATHVRECAKYMPAEAGARYLALVLPKIKDFDHHAPPDLRLSEHRH